MTDASGPRTLSADEAADLGRAVRQVCDQLATEERLREITEHPNDTAGAGFDLMLWKALYAQLEVGTIAAPEHLGGAGYGAAALGIVAHELGRCLAPVPFLASTVLATGLVLDCADSEPHRCESIALTPLIDGDRTAAAVISGGGPWPTAGSAVVSTGGQTPLLTGTAHHVLHGSGADDLVVVAECGPEAVICWLRADTPGVQREPEPVLDTTRPMATIRFDRAPAVTIGAGRGVEGLVAERIHRTIAVLSAEQVGANEKVLEDTVAHARVREQFDRPIGSFQAVKHRCADMLVDLEWSRSASQAALSAADDRPEGSASELSWRASMAKAVCSESLRAASHANVQIHGGIGFTWDHSAHLYLKRARTDEVILGDPAHHWDQLGPMATQHHSAGTDVQGAVDAHA